MSYKTASCGKSLTIGAIQLALQLPDLSRTRRRTQEFKVAEKLLHPIILGNGLQGQEIVIDYKKA